LTNLFVDERITPLQGIPRDKIFPRDQQFLRFAQPGKVFIPKSRQHGLIDPGQCSEELFPDRGLRQGDLYSVIMISTPSSGSVPICMVSLPASRRVSGGGVASRVSAGRSLSQAVRAQTRTRAADERMIFMIRFSG
jgi:hypothetical protein